MMTVTKCTDTQCPSKEQCWRFLVKPSKDQPYADFGRKEGEDKCEEGYLPT